MNKLHIKRMEEDDDEEPMVITKEDFNETIEKFEKKNKRSYDFLTKAGDHFKDSVFKLCKSLIQNEKFPKRFLTLSSISCGNRNYPKMI